MSKIDEIITEIDGKLAFADATGNEKAKEELLEIKRTIILLKDSKDENVKSLCVSCSKGELGCCFCKPNIVINRKVMACSTYKKESENIEIQRLVSTR